MKYAFQSIYIALAFVINTSTIAYAHCCVHTYSQLLASSVMYTSNECQVGEPLHQVTGMHDYPLIGWQLVSYYEGSFLRPAIQTEDRQYFRYDCDGNLMKTWERTLHYKTNVEFTIDNPNLRDNIKSTIDDVVMTDAEAAAAYEKIKLDCQKANSGTGRFLGGL